MKVKSLSRVRLLATSGTAAYQAPLSMGFSEAANREKAMVGRNNLVSGKSTVFGVKILIFKL